MCVPKRWDAFGSVAVVLILAARGVEQQVSIDSDDVSGAPTTAQPSGTNDAVGSTTTTARSRRRSCSPLCRGNSFLERFRAITRKEAWKRETTGCTTADQRGFFAR